MEPVWFLYDRDLRHERVKSTRVKGFNLLLLDRWGKSLQSLLDFVCNSGKIIIRKTFFFLRSKVLWERSRSRFFRHFKHDEVWNLFSFILPVDTGRKLNVHKTFRTRPDIFWMSYVRSIYVLCLRICLLPSLRKSR